MLTIFKPKAPAIPRESLFERARARLAERSAARMQRTRIGFIVDATGSRHETWTQAQRVQAKMFRSASRVGSLCLRLIHFGGNRMTDHGWSDSPQATAKIMAGVNCEVGYTNLLPALWAFTHAPEEERAKAVIVIGDAFEESEAMAADLCGMLKDEGIKVYSFFEGNDAAARGIYRMLAQATGGAFARFGADLPLADLCEGVALLAVGGPKALAALPNPGVQRLLLRPPAPSSRG